MGSSTPASPSSAAYVKKIEYNLDDDGNRSSVVVTPYQQSSQATSYSDNSLNQYTAVGGVSQAHDGNGNLKDDGTFLYEYNYRSLLCRVKRKSDNTTVATYKHDALGRRVERDLGTSRERYIYSGAETVSVYDSTNTWVRDFVFGQGIDEVLMLRQADVTDFDADQDTSEVTRHFYHRNALGSVMLLTDMNEAEGASYRYDPYGAVTITVGGTPQGDDPLGNPFMFTARFQDEETGLMYYRARHYAPPTGRFLQRDPLGYGPGANMYEYARSRPGTLVDPLGLEAGKKGGPPKPPSGRVGDRGAGESMKACWGLKPQAKCEACCEKWLRIGSKAIQDSSGEWLSWCEARYPAQSDEVKRVDAHSTLAMDVLDAIGTISTVADIALSYGAFSKAALEGTITALADAASDVAFSLAYSHAFGNTTIEGATTLLNSLADRNRALAEHANKEFTKCIDGIGRQAKGATGALAAKYAECMLKCQQRNCKDGKEGGGDK